MRNFDPEIILELAKEGFTFFLLTEIELGTGILRWTDCDVDLYHATYHGVTAHSVLNYTDPTGSFTVGSILYGATSGASATIAAVDTINQRLYLKYVSGTFQDNEVIYEATNAALANGTTYKNKYDSADFIFDQIETSGNLGVDSVSMTFNNASLSMGAVVLSEDIMGRMVTVSFLVAIEGAGAVLTEAQEEILLEGGLVDGETLIIEREAAASVGGYSIIGGHSLFYGLVSDWKLQEDSVWIEVQNELVFWSKRTLRKCDSSCPWEYGGDECGHTGSWCNQSYERCNDLLNTDSFGGFRFLPTIAEKDIWWGRSPK